jgi:hypothetical protein
MCGLGAPRHSVGRDDTMGGGRLRLPYACLPFCRQDWFYRRPVAPSAHSRHPARWLALRSSAFWAVHVIDASADLRERRLLSEQCWPPLAQIGSTLAANRRAFALTAAVPRFAALGRLSQQKCKRT